MLKRLTNLFGAPKKKTGPLREELRIGVIASLSGQTAFYGLTGVRGFQMGIEFATDASWQVGGRDIRLLLEDDHGEPMDGLQKAQKLVETDHVHLLQGCTASAVAVKIAHEFKALNCVFMVAVAATDVLTGEWFNPLVFRTASSTMQDAMTGAKYVVEHLGKKVYLFSADYIWGHQSRAAWWKMINENGGEVVGDLMARPDEIDFRSYIEQIRAASPDVLVPSWAGMGTAQLLLQLKESGLTQTCKIAGGMTDHNALVEVGEAAAGMICTVKYFHDFPKNLVNDWLTARHMERFGEPPDVFTESGFSSGVALVRALQKTHGVSDSEQLVRTLEGMSFAAPKGTYTIRAEDHQALQPMYLAELVSVPGIKACEPRLIREVSAEESAPPVMRAK
jgi:branched-chain amino acid transport system substrate-binding protein